MVGLRIKVFGFIIAFNLNKLSPSRMLHGPDQNSCGGHQHHEVLDKLKILHHLFPPICTIPVHIFKYKFWPQQIPADSTHKEKYIS